MCSRAAQQHQALWRYRESRECVSAVYMRTLAGSAKRQEVSGVQSDDANLCWRGV